MSIDLKALGTLGCLGNGSQNRLLRLGTWGALTNYTTLDLTNIVECVVDAWAIIREATDVCQYMAIAAASAIGFLSFITNARQAATSAEADADGSVANATDAQQAALLTRDSYAMGRTVAEVTQKAEIAASASATAKIPSNAGQVAESETSATKQARSESDV